MITVFIPACNEESNIPRVPKELISVMKKLKEKYEILIVDDGSTDNTVREVNKLKKKYRDIRLVKHDANKGLGCAIRTGIANAKGDLFIPLDADFTFHPRQIPRLLNFMKKNDLDCVIGSPFLRKEDRKEIVSYRLWLSQIINYVYALLLKQKITEISGIFRIYKTEQLKKLKITSKGYDINAEILFNLIKDERKVGETYASLTKRKLGESKLNFAKEVKNHLCLLTNILDWRIFFK
jgi:dolichol-phosphate mannosyltransferase